MYHTHDMLIAHTSKSCSASDHRQCTLYSLAMCAFVCLGRLSVVHVVKTKMFVNDVKWVMNCKLCCFAVELCEFVELQVLLVKRVVDFSATAAPFFRMISVC